MMCTQVFFLKLLCLHCCLPALQICFLQIQIIFETFLRKKCNKHGLSLWANSIDSKRTLLRPLCYMMCTQVFFLKLLCLHCCLPALQICFLQIQIIFETFLRKKCNKHGLSLWANSIDSKRTLLRPLCYMMCTQVFSSSSM